MELDRLPADVYAYARRLIRRKAFQLARKEQFSPSDREDIAQDLWLHLCRRLTRYSEERGTIYAFVTTVLERRTATLIRFAAAEKRDLARCSSLSLSVRSHDGMRVELASTITQCAPDPRLSQRRRHDQQMLEMQHDLSDVIASLTPKLQETCAVLAEHSITEAAVKLGIPRTTLYGRVARLRKLFAEAGLQEYL